MHQKLTGSEREALEDDPQMGALCKLAGRAVTHSKRGEGHGDGGLELVDLLPESLKTQPAWSGVNTSAKTFLLTRRQGPEIGENNP